MFAFSFLGLSATYWSFTTIIPALAGAACAIIWFVEQSLGKNFPMEAYAPVTLPFFAACLGFGDIMVERGNDLNLWTGLLALLGPFVWCYAVCLLGGLATLSLLPPVPPKPTRKEKPDGETAKEARHG
jgi:hypothetical protein